MRLRPTSMTLMAIGTIAVSFGVTVAAFSFGSAFDANAVPFRTRGIVTIAQQVGSSELPSVSVLDLGDLKASARAFGDMGACTLYTGAVTAWFFRGEPARKVVPALVSGNFFQLFDVKPLAGSGFLDTDEPQVILSERIWRERYHSDPGVVGKLAGINNDEYDIAAVVPDGFDVPHGADIWVKAPLLSGTFTPYRTNRLFFGFARLPDSVTLQNARAQANSVAARLARQYPASNRDSHFIVLPLFEGLEGRLIAVTRLLKILVLGLFAVAWLNLALLLFARSWNRRGELFVRVALGAGWRHIFRETVIAFAGWTIAGCALGCLLAAGLLGAITSLAGDLLPRYIHPAIHIPTAVLWLLFALLIAVGMAACLTHSLYRVQPTQGLQQGAVRMSPSRSSVRASRTLLGVELALTTAIVLCSVALSQELLKLQNWKLGIEAKGVEDVELVFPAEQRYSRPQLVVATQHVMDSVKAIPGVRATAMATEDPFDNHFNLQVGAPGGPQNVFASIKPVSGDYFETLRIPVIKGHDFLPSDMESYSGNCIVDRHLAALLWPGSDPIGRAISVPGFPSPLAVIGVTGDLNYYSRVKSNIYIPIQTFWSNATTQVYAHLYVKFSEGRDSLALQKVVQEAMPQAFISSPVPLDAWVRRYLLLPRLAARLANPMALATAFLAGLGAFGIAAYIATSRMTEMAIRISFGAGRGQVISLIARSLLLPALVGVASGIAVGIGSIPLWKQALRSSVVFDWRVVAISIGLMAILVVIAAFVPVRRTTRVDPGVLLKSM